MEETTRDFCQLTFLTTADRDRMIRVADPLPGITPAQVMDGAESMIDAFIFDEDAGNLVSLRRADIVRVTTKSLIGSGV